MTPSKHTWWEGLTTHSYLPQFLGHYTLKFDQIAIFHAKLATWVSRQLHVSVSARMTSISLDTYLSAKGGRSVFEWNVAFTNLPVRLSISRSYICLSRALVNTYSRHASLSTSMPIWYVISGTHLESKTDDKMQTLLNVDAISETNFNLAQRQVKKHEFKKTVTTSSAYIVWLASISVSSVC